MKHIPVPVTAGDIAQAIEEDSTFIQSGYVQTRVNLSFFAYRPAVDIARDIETNKGILANAEHIEKITIVERHVIAMRRRK